MTMLRIAVPSAIDPACLAGFDPQAPVIALSGLTMGTQWQVRLAHVAGALPPRRWARRSRPG
jgi:thiamine biosynthesis lipoprotein